MGSTQLLRCFIHETLHRNAPNTLGAVWQPVATPRRPHRSAQPHHPCPLAACANHWREQSTVDLDHVCWSTSIIRQMAALDHEAEYHGDRVRHCAECCNKASLEPLVHVWCVVGRHGTHQDMQTESEWLEIACDHTSARSRVRGCTSSSTIAPELKGSQLCMLVDYYHRCPIGRTAGPPDTRPTSALGHWST